ncbi:hypothetical protein K469DRAFT_500499, partial [Zopfia rhizophila CBS 207.26]
FPPLTVLDPKGSLTIITGNEYAQDDTGPPKFQVSPKTMRLASRVWDSMFEKLDSHWPSRKNKTIAFDQDDPHMLLVVLNIVHFRFKELPGSLGFGQLVELARICQRYDLVGIMKPFLPQWTRRFQDSILNPGREKWLLIAHQFGYVDDFERIARHLVVHCTVNGEGRLVSLNGKVLLEEEFPPTTICK